MNARFFVIPLLFLFLACTDEPAKDSDDQAAAKEGDLKANAPKGSYAYDAEFLKKNTAKVIELQNAAGSSRILLSADYQGRVMTSSAKGDSGTSYGWLNYDLIAAPQKKKQFNPVGGEERFWLGPEGGQYSIYFKGKDSFSFSNWQVPAIIDTIAYDVERSDNRSATFTKTASVTNYSGTTFNLEIRRNIRLLVNDSVSDRLKTTIDPSLSTVAYETENSIKNAGTIGWKKESGLLSIWLLAMLTPSDETKVIVPFESRKNAADLITQDYFGKIPPDRLAVKDGYLVLNCDGRFRSKVGIPPVIAKPVAGSFDFKRNVLTVILFSVDKSGSYVNSKWEHQKQPYRGDAVNAYNDGPLADGTQMGPFYEIESSSAAKELKPGESQVYKQSTFHFEGEYAKLEALALKLLGVKLSEVK